MDVAAFSGDNFDPKEWINKALRTGEPSQLKEEAAASLVMKLQLMIAKLNSALEDQCGAVVQSIPRVIRDAAQLESEAGDRFGRSTSVARATSVARQFEPASSTFMRAGSVARGFEV